MTGSSLSYEQMSETSSNLNKYATDMQQILDEIRTLLNKLGNDGVWAGTAAMEAKTKFDTLDAKFEAFYNTVMDESKYLAAVVEDYKKVDNQLVG